VFTPVALTHESGIYRCADPVPTLCTTFTDSMPEDAAALSKIPDSSSYGAGYGATGVELLGERERERDYNALTSQQV